MSPRLTWATAHRILQQIRYDRRTLGLIFGLPTVLMGLLALLLIDRPGAFDAWGAPLLGVFPLIVMFLVTSVATLRERTSGTLERLLAMPIGRGDLLGGYAIAFSLLGALQAIVVSLFSFGLFGLDIAGSALLVGLVAVADAVLGTALGLAASSLARTEFQAVQMMPLMLLPQLILCGLIVPRDQMPTILEWVSYLMPLSYAMTATFDAMVNATVTATYLLNLGAVLAFAAAALAIGGPTLRRQSA